MALSRRELLARSGAAGAGITLAGAVDTLFTAFTAFTANPQAGRRGPASGYGPLVPDPRGLLDLPSGFRYRVLSREGERLKSGGGVVPSRFDGQAAFPGRRESLYLVRNHEARADAPHPVRGPRSHTYDPLGPGGTTTLRLDTSGRLVEEYVSLAGTFVNCAGGTTPWGTWLSCEEIEESPVDSSVPHGWIFEVDPRDNRRNADPTPLEAMGRFQHEALAVDPATGVVYETEDAFDFPFGLFYRFLPDRPLGGHGSLRAGGVLEAMRVPGVPDLSPVQEVGTTFRGLEWVRVPDPLATATPTRLQDYGPRGVTHAQKLEGAWWGDGAAYFVASFARGGDGSRADHDGQVWRHDPVAGTLELVVVFRFDPADQVFEAPDNITVSPFGGLMIAEDGGGQQHLVGTTSGGEAFPFARNRQNIGTPQQPEFGEFAGVTFSGDGETLFVNCYNPGTTFAVTGPWRRQR